MLRDSNDQESLSYTLWALSYLSNSVDSQIQAVYKALDAKTILKYGSEDGPPATRLPAWRLIGNLLSGKIEIAAVSSFNEVDCLMHSLVRI